MKAIIISIKPEWVAKILNGEKTIEIRKTMPKCDLPIDVYICCAKGKEKLWRHDNLKTFGKLSKNVEKQFCAYGKTARELDDKLLDFLYENGIEESISRGVDATLLNGKVVAKFTLNNYDKWLCHPEKINEPDEEDKQISKNCCLTFEEVIAYAKDKPFYGWHIDNLVIFDKPKELSEFKRCTEKTCIYGKCHKYMHCLKPLTKIPRNWCYIEV